MDVKLIRAFIASPSGLEAERHAARAVAEQVNRSVARELGGRLELIGWEETLSGVGRPQASINEDLESCELFIGAMWTRWGTKPSHDGPYSSGFEEEFELSRQRHASTCSPVMAMFFKNIDQMQLADPGDELKKVLHFQEKLRNEKAFLYGTFTTSEEFAGKVRDFLTAHTIRLLRTSNPTADDKPAEPQRPNSDGAQTLVSAPPKGDAKEALFLVRAAKAFDEEDGFSAAEVARLRLVAATSGVRGNDKVVLGVHDANLLYHERSVFDLSISEIRGLLQAGFAELSHENVPVWSWLAEITRGKAERLILLSAFGDEIIRAGALTAMRLFGQSITDFALSSGDLVEDYWLGSLTPNGVRASALRYLRDYGARKHLGAIEAEAERGDKDTVTAAQEAALAILLREDAQAAGAYLLSISFETFDSALLAVALRQLDELATETLTQGLDHRAAQVKARTLDILSSRGELGLETIGRAIEDDAAIVRLAGLRARDRLGYMVSFDEAFKVVNPPKRRPGLLFYTTSNDPAAEALFDDYRTERLRQMPVSAVEALLRDPNHRHAAYLALASRKVSDFGARLRADLVDLFQRYAAEHWPEGIKPLYAATTLLAFGTVDPLEIKRRELVRQALDVITGQRNHADLSLVRQVLHREFVGPNNSTIVYLRALGDASDIELLGRVRGISYLSDANSPGRSVFNEAARAILALHKGSIEELLAAGLRDDMRAILLELMPATSFSTLSDAAIVKLLLSDQEAVRRAVARKTPASVSRSRVRKILAAYRSNEEGRFYIVTHWLDLGLAYSTPTARRVIIGR